MKAILHKRYGAPELLEYADVAKPEPKDDEVLIKVHATTVTSADCNVRSLRFAPKIAKFPARLFFGLFKPRFNILGTEFSGTIEAVGKDVAKFKAGDAVLGSPGMAFGAHAEYLVMPENGEIVQKPENISFEQAASLFFGGHTSLFFLRDKAQVKKGQKVLINGASGCLGTYAVQLAKYFGAEVTAVCSTGNVEMVTSLGADHVIDYKKEDFTKGDEKYDIIYDTVGKASVCNSRKVLKKDGVYLSAYFRFEDIAESIWTGITGSRKVLLVGAAPEKIEDLKFLTDLMARGVLTSVIDKTYPLEKTAEAFRYVEEGHKKGNVVINVFKGKEEDNHKNGYM